MKLIIISHTESDLSHIFKSCCETKLVSPDETVIEAVESYDAVAVIGGTTEKPLILNAFLRSELELFADSGKPVFIEYTGSFRCVYSAQPTYASPHRLVSCGELTDEILSGDLLDSRYNSYIHPHFLMPETEVLLYYRQYTPAHDRFKNYDKDNHINDAALFKSKNILTAAFRMCNYIKGGFAPRARWDSLVCYICGFLGIPKPSEFPESNTKLKKFLEKDFYSELDDCTDRALGLLKEFLVESDGSKGIKEGLSHNILPDGKRFTAEVIRTDCIGEAAGSFLFSGDEALKLCAEKMLDLCYGPLMINGGEYDGMMRWSEEAWNVCYQDDVARAIIPSLLYGYFGFSDKYVLPAHHALKFLNKTSCKDGLRPARTDILEFIKSGESVRSLAQQESGLKSAHYNSWYSAALLLGYLLTKDETLKENGIKGLETLMEVYPDTVREHSETSELCRLIFPLATLYRVTGDKRHYEMLDRVFNDLLRYRHISGGYMEWDSGYKATCFNNAGGECSLLAENGDPVADLLYSLNWLPLGFAFALHSTGEERFLTAWKDICEFFIKAQLISDNPKLNGAWCRGIDLDRLEYYGIPHDVGWGPCCVETGWTVSEITTGMLIGKRLINGDFNEK